MHADADFSQFDRVTGVGANRSKGARFGTIGTVPIRAMIPVGKFFDGDFVANFAQR